MRFFIKNHDGMPAMNSSKNNSESFEDCLYNGEIDVSL